MPEIDIKGETEESLVAALRQGRQEMLGKLYDAYAPMMMGVISRIVHDNEVAEEVLKETFIAIWTRIGVYDSSRERLLSWGLSIARGIALEAVKTDRYTQAAKDKEAAESKPQQNKSAPIQSGKIKKEDICSLSPLEKTILDLLYLKGRSCVETAGELNMTVEEVKKTLKKAFTHLKAGKTV